jgi:hypothetical protein
MLVLNKQVYLILQCNSIKLILHTSSAPLMEQHKVRVREKYLSFEKTIECGKQLHNYELHIFYSDKIKKIT